MFASVLIVLFGILLPAITLIVELSNGMCAEVFFDPIPTLGHVFLVALVPAGNLLALIAFHGNWMRWRTPLLWLNGVVLGIALFYTLVFLPISPLAVIAIIAWGMGLLPLAPFCSLLSALGLRYRLARMTAPESAETQPARKPERRSTLVSLLVGGALGILLLLAFESRVALTLIGAEMAADNDSPGRQLRGVRMLRTFGNREELLRMCYRDGRSGGGPFSRGHSLSMCGYLFDGVPRDEAQKIFFRVTGEPYNSLPPPRGVNRAMWDDFDFDPDIGGEKVAGRRRNLSLSSSRIDAKLYPDAAVAYIEWTMVFRNDGRSQSEARAQVLLPPGGVVSRATLWVSGEPREAAFAGTAQVRQAYQKVAVQQRRDPLLVTWAGEDRALVQCFPVPPNGEMKIRLGITAPLTIVKSDAAALRMPCFAERNFGVAARDIHGLWIESDRPSLHAPEQLHGEKAGEKHVLRGMLADDLLSAPTCTVTVPRSAEATESWTPDKSDPKKYVLQKIVSARPPAKTRIVAVVDGSREMAEHFEAIGEALAAAKEGVEIRALLAGDEVADLSEAVGIRGGPKGLAARMREMGGAGGCDNVPALLKAFDEAGDEKTIVWIHGQQSIVLQPAAPLIQWMERGSKATIHDFAVGSGANRLAELLGPLGCMRPVPRTGSVRDDLRDLIARLTGQTEIYRLERTLVEGTPPKTPRSTSHLARLWAAGEAAALAGSGKPAKRAEAVKLAAANQLVTPVSGAVVLENKQQYEESDLKPADPETVPDLPEPATWIMLLTALPLLLWQAWKRRRRNTSAASS